MAAQAGWQGVSFQLMTNSLSPGCWPRQAAGFMLEDAATLLMGEEWDVTFTEFLRWLWC